MFESLPTYTILLPAILIAGAWFLSKVLRFSIWITLLIGCTPFVLPYLDLPFSRSFLDAHPLYLIGGGWALLLCIALGRACVLPVLGEAHQSPAGMVRVAYGVMLGSSLLLVALLVSRPGIVEQVAPGWKGTAGLVLLCASLLSMSLWLARVLKAAFVFALWSLVSLVLASELFLNKLPHHVVREDLAQLQPLASRFGLSDVLEKIEGFSADSGAVTDGVTKRLKAFVLGGTPNTGFPFDAEASLSHSLEREFQRRGVELTVKGATFLGSSSFQTRDLVATQVLAQKPDLVFLVGWKPDAAIGRNAYGIPGLDEAEAREYVAGIRSLHRYPFAADIVESKLFRYFSSLSSEAAGKAAIDESRPRVTAEVYKQQLLESVTALQSSGAQVVLMSEPALDTRSAPYRDAMREVAESTRSPLVPVYDILPPGNGRLFARGDVLSPEGYRVVAAKTAEMLAEGSVFPSSKALFDSARLPYNQSGEATNQSGEVAGVVLEGAQQQGSPQTRIREGLAMLVQPEDVRGDLLFALTLAEPGTRYYRVTFSVNGVYVADRRLDSRSETRVRFTLPEEARKFGVAEIAVRTIASPPPNDDLIGSTEFFTPLPISVVSDPTGGSYVQVGKRAFFARSKGVGGVGVSVDSRSGDVLSVVKAESPVEISKWLLAQPWGAVVSLAVQGLDADGLKTGTRYIGVPTLPTSGGIRAYALLGVAGVKKGEGIAKTSQGDPVTIEMGSPILRAYSRFTVSSIFAGDRQIPLP